MIITVATPLELTQELLDVSVTERIAFRHCRRRWYLETIENLEPRGRTQSALMFGRGIHAALEAYYLGEGEGERDTGAMFAAFDAWHEEAQEELRDADGSTEDANELVGMHDLGKLILENYVVFDTTTRVDVGDVLAVEGNLVGDPVDWPRPPEGYPGDAAVAVHESGRLMCPIVDPDTKVPLPDLPCLTARIDLLTARNTPHTGHWIVDHKTAAKAPSDRGVEFDDQVTGYCYVVWRWIGMVPRGAIYNVLIKQRPQPPRVLKNGDLSAAKDQLTTPKLYREALKDHGLIIPGSGTISTAKHEACMDSLLAHGWDRFFRRIETMRSEHELLAFERRLFNEYRHMQAARENEDDRFPNPTTWSCPNCAAGMICRAMEEGSDVEYIIDHNYVQAPDRKA